MTYHDFRNANEGNMCDKGRKSKNASRPGGQTCDSVVREITSLPPQNSLERVSTTCIYLTGQRKHIFISQNYLVVSSSKRLSLYQC